MEEVNITPIIKRKPDTATYNPLLYFYGQNSAFDKYIIQVYLIFAASVVVQNFSSASALIMMVGCAIYVIYFARWDIKRDGLCFQKV